MFITGTKRRNALNLGALVLGVFAALSMMPTLASASSDHRAHLTFELSGHLVASGEVKIPDGHNKCAGDRRVAIERRKASGRWKTVRHDRTGHRGLYRVTLPDATGKYRAEVRNKRLAHGLCLPDESRTRAYPEPSGSGHGPCRPPPVPCPSTTAPAGARHPR